MAWNDNVTDRLRSTPIMESEDRTLPYSSGSLSFPRRKVLTETGEHLLLLVLVPYTLIKEEVLTGT